LCVTGVQTCALPIYWYDDNPAIDEIQQLKASLSDK
jgi:hypothetical protein